MLIGKLLNEIIPALVVDKNPFFDGSLGNLGKLALFQPDPDPTSINGVLEANGAPRCFVVARADDFQPNDRVVVTFFNTAVPTVLAGWPENSPVRRLDGVTAANLKGDDKGKKNEKAVNKAVPETKSLVPPLDDPQDPLLPLTGNANDPDPGPLKLAAKKRASKKKNKTPPKEVEPTPPKEVEPTPPKEVESTQGQIIFYRSAEVVCDHCGLDTTVVGIPEGFTEGSVSYTCEGCQNIGPLNLNKSEVADFKKGEVVIFESDAPTKTKKRVGDAPVSDEQIQAMISSIVSGSPPPTNQSILLGVFSEQVSAWGLEQKVKEWERLTKKVYVEGKITEAAMASEICAALVNL